MTNTQRFAQRELDILVKSADVNDRPIIEPFIPELLALCEKFGLNGDSGGSAPYTAGALASAVKNLCLQKPICPITGIDEEWVDTSGMGDGDLNTFYQNSRCSALFKDVNDEAWYLDAIAWKDEKGMCWSGSAILPNGNRITARKYIKGFPFTPKTFYVDVISKEVKKDDWEFYVKDEKQLDEVFEYYKSPIQLPEPPKQ